MALDWVELVAKVEGILVVDTTTVTELEDGVELVKILVDAALNDVEDDVELLKGAKEKLAAAAEDEASERVDVAVLVGTFEIEEAVEVEDTAAVDEGTVEVTDVVKTAAAVVLTGVDDVDEELEATGK